MCCVVPSLASTPFSPQDMFVRVAWEVFELNFSQQNLFIGQDANMQIIQYYLKLMTML